MRAVILSDGKLVIQDVPKPSPGYEEALVKLTAAGICHSDLHLVKNDWPGFLPPFPIPMGHEGIGIVEELGPGAEKFVNKGDRVILGLGGTGGGYWCGACEYCLSGRPRLCKQAKGVIGAYAEYISLWVKSLVKLPDEISDREVPLACGGLTAYSAVKKLIKFDVLPGKPVAIIGAAGGLGHYAVQVAKAFGYKVVGVDVGPEKIEFIKSLGSDYAVPASEAEKFCKEQLSGVYASIVFSPKIAGFQLGLKLLRRGGVFVGVGMPPVSEGPISIGPLELLGKDPLIMSSAVGTVEEMRELIQLAADGKVKTHVGRVAGLSEIGQVLEELEQGRYFGRAIIDDMTR
jgi:propanol-preferring alcohol dehydrogenase